jgi:tRNA A37 N6-isopentenylltransferase MiaA
MESPISRTAAKALGLTELTTLPLDEAAERIEQRTRRYAAYQRKWMRRIPGIELVPADRPTTEVVDAILDLARAR